MERIYTLLAVQIVARLRIVMLDDTVLSSCPVLIKYEPQMTQNLNVLEALESQSKLSYKSVLALLTKRRHQ